MKSLMKGVKKRLIPADSDPNSQSTNQSTSQTHSLNSTPSKSHSSVNSSSSSANQSVNHSTSQSTSQPHKSPVMQGQTVDQSTLPRCRQSRSVPRDVLIHSLPSLRDSNPQNRRALLLKKLRLCCYQFSFDESVIESSQESKEKELKRNTLLELVNYLSVFKPVFSEEELVAIFEMLHCNLFRPLPPSLFELTGHSNPEEDEPNSEPAWIHLQVVYEFLLRLATAAEAEPKDLDKHFNRRFILNLLELFDSEDPRERDYLKTILHRIYGNFMSLRPFIRRAINNIFYRFIYETDRHNGIAELLEILGSIINGFALPLKEQHKSFLIRVLLPLHKNTHMSIFHPQLTYCVTQFIEKDATLAPNILKYLLKFWPQTASKKELMFLNELEEIMDRIRTSDLTDKMELALFNKIASCCNSPHFQISERALFVLNQDIIGRFVANRTDLIMPLLAKSLLANTRVAVNLAGESTIELDPEQQQRNLRITQMVEQSIERMREMRLHAMQDGNTKPMQIDNESMSDEDQSNNQTSFTPISQPTEYLTATMLVSPSPYPLSALPSPHSMHLGHGSAASPGHWNATIMDLTSDVLKVLGEYDSKTISDLQQMREAEIEERVRHTKERFAAWMQLDALARQHILQSQASSSTASGTAQSIEQTGMPTIVSAETATVRMEH